MKIIQIKFANLLEPFAVIFGFVYAQLSVSTSHCLDRVFAIFHISGMCGITCFLATQVLYYQNKVELRNLNLVSTNPSSPVAF